MKNTHTYIPVPTYIQTYTIRSYHSLVIWGTPQASKLMSAGDPWQSGSARQDVFLPSSLQVAAAHHGSRARGGALAWEPRGAMGKTMGRHGKSMGKAWETMGKLGKHMMIHWAHWVFMAALLMAMAMWKWWSIGINFWGGVFLTKPHSVLLAATGS